MNQFGHSLDPIDLACPYCDGKAPPVGGASVYPHRSDLHDKRFYFCEPCKAWVGCHPNTWEPLGRIANAALRRAKQAAHAAFDPVWKLKGTGMNRHRAYGWLAGELGISREDCHIGMFDEEMCAKVVRVCRTRREARA